MQLASSEAQARATIFSQIRFFPVFITHVCSISPATPLQPASQVTIAHWTGDVHRATSYQSYVHPFDYTWTIQTDRQTNKP